jgi:2-polyprenyl-6-methoxyphenol hydroxylase-like FAD-dependent oxidoreductase
MLKILKTHAVVIVGAGPTGLMLAAELKLAGVDAAIVERRASPELIGARAGGLHSRTIEVLDQRGIAERFLAEGQKAQVAIFAGTSRAVADPDGTNLTLKAEVILPYSPQTRMPGC